jgi:hypothetical protein
MVSWSCGARVAMSAVTMISHMIHMIRSIHPTRMGNDSQNLARLMRPSKEKRYQFQSMGTTSGAVARPGPEIGRPWIARGSISPAATR